MSRRLLTYEKKDTWIDDLCGASKLIYFLCWSLTCMLTYDTRILIVMLLISIIMFRVSKTDFKQVAGVFKLVMVFMVINVFAIFMFSPYQGTAIYGTKSVICHLFGKYDLTYEQLFYEMNVLLKYFTIVPSVFIFIVTTNPSEFAASLNRIGVSYNVGYAVSLALRYIPDVQEDFTKIKNAQMARGIEMSSKGRLMDRIKHIVAIILPLVFTSMSRIDTISNAMELRSFGKNKKRTWYMGRPFKRTDYIFITVCVAFMVAALGVTYADGNRFFNPFIH